VFTAENVVRPMSWLARRRRRRLLESARGVIAGSAAAADLVRSVRADVPVALIPQLGVTVPPTPEHDYHEGLAIGYVGRLVPEKGVDTLLLALAANRAERWHLTIVGEGPERERLERLASEARLASRTRWAGALPPDRLAGLWPTLDVLVQPSHDIPGWSEPTGQILMEAMSHEVAVVGSDAGVTPEIIGEAGVVVPAGDAAALAAALRRVAADSVRQPLTRAGRARVMERFSDVAVAERTTAFWREVLG